MLYNKKWQCCEHFITLYPDFFKFNLKHYFKANCECFKTRYCKNIYGLKNSEINCSFSSSIWIKIYYKQAPSFSIVIRRFRKFRIDVKVYHRQITERIRFVLLLKTIYGAFMMKKRFKQLSLTLQTITREHLRWKS